MFGICILVYVCKCDLGVMLVCMILAGVDFRMRNDLRKGGYKMFLPYNFIEKGVV